MSVAPVALPPAAPPAVKVLLRPALLRPSQSLPLFSVPHRCHHSGNCRGHARLLLHPFSSNPARFGVIFQPTISSPAPRRLGPPTISPARPPPRRGQAPTFLLLGRRDQIVPVWQHEEVFRALRSSGPPRVEAVMENGNHCFLDPEQSFPYPSSDCDLSLNDPRGLLSPAAQARSWGGTGDRPNGRPQPAAPALARTQRVVEVSLKPVVVQAPPAVTMWHITIRTDSSSSWASLRLRAANPQRPLPSLLQRPLLFSSHRAYSSSSSFSSQSLIHPAELARAQVHRRVLPRGTAAGPPGGAVRVGGGAAGQQADGRAWCSVYPHTMRRLAPAAGSQRTPEER